MSVNFAPIYGESPTGTRLPVNVDANGNIITTPLSSGTQAVNLTEVNGSAIALGQTTMAASLPVALASNQSNVPENLTQVGGSAIALGQTTMAASLPVALASNQSNIPENLTQVGGSAIALGQTTMAASLPVVLASNQSAVPNNLTQVNGSAVGATNPVPASDDFYTYTNINTNTTTAIKSGAGSLAYLTVNNPGSTWTITVYDNTTGTGTKIATITAINGLINTNTYKVKFNTGLTVVTAGTTAGDITVSWR